MYLYYLNYPPFTKLEDIEEQKNNYFNIKKKLLSNLNLCDYDGDLMFHLEKKNTLVFSVLKYHYILI